MTTIGIHKFIWQAPATFASLEDIVGDSRRQKIMGERESRTSNSHSLNRHKRHFVGCGPSNEKAISSKQTLEFIINDLAHPSQNTRTTAKKKLLGIGEDAVPALTQALKSDNPTIREQVAKVFIEMGEPAKDALPELIEALQDDLALVRTNSAKAIGEMGEGAKNAIPALVKLLGDHRPRVYAEVKEALKKIGIDVVPHLGKALKDDNHGLRLQALNLLEEFGKDAKGALPELIEILQKESIGRIRAKAAEVIGNIGEEARDAIPALVKALESHNESVWFRATFALKKIGNISSDDLKIALTHSSKQVRDQAQFLLSNNSKQSLL